MQAPRGLAAGRTHTHWPSYKSQCTAPTPHCRPVVRVNSSPSGQGGADASSLFSQHKVLLEAGFSYDQAALILQVSQQRKAAAQPTPAAPAGPAAVTPEPDATQLPAPGAGTPAPAPAALQPLEARIAFLELELLKQSLSLPAASSAQLPPGPSALTPAGTNLTSTAAALNPAGAGAGGLSAAAAAAAARWSADSTLLRQPPQQGAQELSWPAQDAVSVSTQLATAAELGQLEPEVYALAEALAVRQGFAALPAEPQPGPYALSAQQQQYQPQQRRPASIWGRARASGPGSAGLRSHHLARPLSANAWGDQLYDPAASAGYGEPLLRQQDLEEEVPYNPSGWAVAGTVVMVYLGVIVTFMAICVGDMPY